MNNLVSSGEIGSGTSFYQATLDSLASHIAILDREGTILGANAAWHNFARDNGGGGETCGQGANYLRACDRATGECSEGAREVAQGIRDVIAGRRDRFYREYPCHSSTVNRWFSIRITRFVVDGKVLVVVAHDDITMRKLAEIKLRGANRKLARQASTDGMTGIPNRRSFDRSILQAWASFTGGGPPFTLALMDVDSFKAYNDHRGHLAGDDCLRAVARAIRARLHRLGDRTFRYGGEEFAAILPRTDAPGASGALNGVLETVRELSIPHTRSRSGRGVVTLSVGCSTATLGRDASPADLIHRADRALYEAKALGRDRLVASEAIGAGSA